VYRRAFATPATAVEPASFVRGLERYDEAGYDYHLWALREAANGAIAGMASFFSFNGIGFGGYIVLEAGLRGAGCLRPLLARIEQQMRADERRVRGWLIECENEMTATVFARCGFSALALDYHQPELPGAAVASALPLRLMYKPLGRVYAQPVLSAGDLLTGLAEVLRYVYRIDEPQTHATYRAVAAQVDRGVPFG
jgi:GNAT superfamily N-acetyltransferase